MEICRFTSGKLDAGHVNYTFTCETKHGPFSGSVIRSDDYIYYQDGIRIFRVQPNDTNEFWLGILLIATGQGWMVRVNKPPKTQARKTVKAVTAWGGPD